MLLLLWQCHIMREAFHSSSINSGAAAGLMLMLLQPWPPRRSTAAGKQEWHPTDDIYQYQLTILTKVDIYHKLAIVGLIQYDIS